MGSERANIARKSLPGGDWSTKVLAISAFAVMAVFASCQRNPEVLSPDYEVDFGCRIVPAPELIERFMTAHGFASFDEEGARRRKYGASFYAVQIDGYDRSQRMLDVIGLRKPTSFGGHVSYRLSITGPPPTLHDNALEEAAARFVTEDLGCSVEAVHRYANAKTSVVFFDAIYADEQRRIHALRV